MRQMFLLLLFSTPLFSQENKSLESLLIGTWQLTSEHKGANKIDTISFYPDYRFQPFNVDSFEGKWHINEKGKYIYYSGPSILPHYDTISIATYKSFILELNDSVLVLSTKEYRQNAIITNYEQTKNITKQSYQLLYYPELEDPDSIPNPLLNHNLLLVNSLDTSKKIIIKEAAEITLHYSTISGDSTYSLYQAADGFSYGLNDSAFVIQLTQIRTDYDSVRSRTTFRNSVFNYYDYPYRNVNISAINRISYSNPSRSFCNGFGSSLLFLSIIDALVVAPLVSIGYSHNGFKMKRYSAFAGVGLIGIGLSIPLIIFGQNKDYHITPKGNFSDKHYWYLQSA